MPDAAVSPSARGLYNGALTTRPAKVDVLSPRTAPRAVVAYDGLRPGLSTVVPEGGYRGTVAWTSREIFLKGLRLAMEAHPERRRITAKDSVALDTFMRVVELLALSADHGNGRDVRGRKKEIAEAAGCSAATVQRVGRIASRVVRCLQLIVRGRPLTLDERTGPGGVWRRVPIRGHRLKQHGVPPVRAFHVPAWLRPYMAMAAIQTMPVDNPAGSANRSAHQPCKGRVSETTHLPDTSPSEPTSSKSGSLRSPSGPGSARAAPTRTVGPSPGFRLAVELVKAMPLLHSTSPKRLQHALKRFAESRPVWTPQDLLDAFQTLGEQLGQSVPLTADLPWALIVWFLRQLDTHDDHPRLMVVDPAELRCDRPKCDHGWISETDNTVRRCAQCRPGAWPEPELTDDQEPPF